MTNLDTEKPVCLIPEIFEPNYTPDAEVFTLSYDLPRPVRSMAWNGNLLALSHDSGVSILTPITKTAPLSKNLPSELQQEWVFQLSAYTMKSPVSQLRFTSKYLVMALENGHVVLMNHLDGSQLQLSTTGGHHGGTDINSVDVSDQGVVCVADDERRVTVWEHGEIVKTVHLETIPTLVKFWADKDSDKIIVVDSGKSVKVYDWRKDVWLYTIYPLPHAQNSNPFILDVVVVNGNIVVIGDGWWKEYDTEQLQGGAGYTYPTTEGSLNGWLPDSKYVSCQTSPLIGGIVHDRCCFYDLTSRSGQGQQFKLELPSATVSAGTINHQGVVAFASGAKLILTKPFDSYEAVQY